MSFIEENDQTRARREHLEAIRALVGEVYPNKFERSRVFNPPHEDTITAAIENATRIIEDEATAKLVSKIIAQAKRGERPAPEENQAANHALNSIRARLAGRLAVPPRVMGKAAFVHLSDGKSRLQIYIRKDESKIVGVASDLSKIYVRYQTPEVVSSEGREADGWELLNLLDHGDFIGVAGYLFLTKTGELSVHVEEITFLAKALVPMPDKLHGVSDPEIREFL